MGTFHPSRSAATTASLPTPAPSRAVAVLAEIESTPAPPQVIVSRIVQAFASECDDAEARAADETLVVQLLRDIGAPADGRLDVPAIIEHSLAAAHAAEALAQIAGVRRRQAFFAGALHDVGKLALNARHPRGYARVIERTIAEHRDLCDAESDVLGVDHARAGRRLVAHWKLPRGVQDCAWLHHQLPAEVEQLAEAPKLVTLVCVADAIARRLRPGFAGFGGHEPPPDVLTRLGVSEAMLRSIESAVSERLQTNARATNRAGQTRRARKAPFGKALRELLDAIGNQTFPGQIATCIAESVSRIRRQDHAAVLLVAEVAGRAELGVFMSGRRSVHQLDIPRSQRFVPDLDEESVRWQPVAGPLRQLADAVERHMSARLDDLLPLIHGHQLVGMVLAQRAPRGGLSSTGWSNYARICGAALASAIDRRRSDAQTEEIAALRRRVQVLEKNQATPSAASHIARMAAGAAHELNNPLAVISARAQMLLDAEVDDRAAASLKAIREQASRASEMVTDLLRLSRPRPAMRQPSTVLGWAQQLRQHWQGRFDLSPDAITVRVADVDARMFVDADQLTEAATEIAANSLASAGSENLRLLINSDSRATDETMVVSIGDNGAGMTPEVLRHALDPFYSERRAGRGRGLGLCKAAALIEANGGRIWIESAEGRGATVYLALPARVTG